MKCILDPSAYYAPLFLSHAFALGTCYLWFAYAIYIFDSFMLSTFAIIFLWLQGNKRKQIIEVVKYLDERLKELDEEKEDLRKYQQLDKQRKSLEYTIYEKELQDARQKLAKVSITLNDFIVLFFSWWFVFLKK